MADEQTRPSPAAPRDDSLRGDVAELIEARLELARLDLQDARGQLQRLALLLALCGLAAVVGVAQLATAIAESLAARTVLSRGEALGLLGLGLLLVAGCVAWIAWLRFRGGFRGLASSQEEFREDLAWLRGWLHGDGPSGGDPDSGE